DRARERELRAAEPLDEVAAPAGPDVLERLELAVDRAVAAGDPLRPDAVARDDPLPLEQELRQGPAVGRDRAPGCEQPRGERPAVATSPETREREKRRGRRSAVGTP